MQRIVAVFLGLLVGVLGIAGLMVEEGRLLDLMNVDTPIDVLRLVLATALLVSGLVVRSAARAVLVVTGVLYIGMGVVALLDPTIGGLLPTGFSGFDIGFHLVAGAGALVIGLIRGGRREPSMGTEHRAASGSTPREGR